MDPAAVAGARRPYARTASPTCQLVRKVGNGSWQMVSGHRRKAAYALLAKDDPAYERMPCRVIEGIDDERAVTLLHAANYFTRALTVTERAAATEALRGDAVRLRSEDPSLSGMRVDDVKAAIIERQTGRKVSGKTIAREERLARRIAEGFSPGVGRRGRPRQPQRRGGALARGHAEGAPGGDARRNGALAAHQAGALRLREGEE